MLLIQKRGRPLLSVRPLVILLLGRKLHRLLRGILLLRRMMLRESLLLQIKLLLGQLLLQRGGGLQIVLAVQGADVGRHRDGLNVLLLLLLVLQLLSLEFLL